MSDDGENRGKQGGWTGLVTSLKLELGDFRGLTANLKSELGDLFEKDRGWKLAALALVGVLAIVVVIQQGLFDSRWQAECESNWGSFFEERFYSEDDIDRLVEACVKVAEDWEDDGVADETIRGSLIYDPQFAQDFIEG